MVMHRRALVLVHVRRGAFSADARRMAREYAMFSLGLLALVSAVGAVSFFIDLFVQFGGK